MVYTRRKVSFFLVTNHGHVFAMYVRPSWIPNTFELVLIVERGDGKHANNKIYVVEWSGRQSHGNKAERSSTYRRNECGRRRKNWQRRKGNLYAIFYWKWLERATLMQFDFIIASIESYPTYCISIQTHRRCCLIQPQCIYDLIFVCVILESTFRRCQ